MFYITLFNKETSRECMIWKLESYQENKTMSMKKVWKIGYNISLPTVNHMAETLIIGMPCKYIFSQFHLKIFF